MNEKLAVPNNSGFKDEAKKEPTDDDILIRELLKICIALAPDSTHGQLSYIAAHRIAELTGKRLPSKSELKRLN